MENSFGAVVEAHDYYPFGLLMPGRDYQSAERTKELFTGKERDGETGLDYFGARYYWAAGGRWWSVDPLSDDHPEITAYHYTFNNPLRYIDPIGLDSLKVSLPKDRTKEGKMTLVVKGEEKTLEGGDQVLGLGVTDKGKNPTRNPMKSKGDTPTGEADATKVFDTDPKGEFVNAEGKPVENAKGSPNKYLKAFGRFFIKLVPQKGDLKKSGRSGIGIHGGGTRLGKSALNAKQKLVRTHGCLRCTNQTAAQIAKQAKDAIKNKRTFRVIIVEDK